MTKYLRPDVTVDQFQHLWILNWKGQVYEIYLTEELEGEPYCKLYGDDALDLFTDMVSQGVLVIPNQN